MTYLFIIQGEGRGHMTQALALADILRSAGHELAHVIVGKSERRELPAFFTEKIKAPITRLDSPNFVTDKEQKSVKPFRTIVHSLLHAHAYRQSIREIDRIVKETRPDVILNFYDFLGGLYHFSRRPKAKFICLAHQYLIAHPEFEFPEGRHLDRLSLRIANKITSLGANRVLGLSFQPFADQPRKRLFVVPPLLRQQVKALTVSSGDHFLVYMVNPGYSEEVERFHQDFPEQPLHCFWDKKDKPTEWQVDKTLTYHQLDDVKFLEKMAAAKGYVTTAGFESVCEAMYLGKPVLMVPVAGHYEQACNAVDAVKAGAGTSSNHFEIARLSEYLPDYRKVSDWFRPWADSAPDHYLKHLT